MDKDVVVLESTATRIPVHLPGYYSESLIHNGAIFDIVIVGSGGERTIVKSDPTGDGKVRIYIRNHNGVREDMEARRGTELAIAQKVISIRPHLIETGSYYEPISGLMLANINIGSTVKHPDTRTNYNTVLQEVFDAVRSKDVTKIVFAANDPSRTLKSFYCCLGKGNCFEIKCTNISTTSKSSFTIELVSELNTITQYSCELDELIDVGSIALEVFDGVVTLGMTVAEAMDRYDDATADSNDRFNTRLNNRVESIKTSYEEKISLDAARHAAALDKDKVKLQEVENKLTSMTIKLNACEQECNKLKTSAEEWRTLYEARSNADSIDLDRADLRGKSEEQIHKTTRAKYAATSEQSKANAVLIKVIIGLVCVVAGSSLGSFMSSNK